MDVTAHIYESFLRIMSFSLYGEAILFSCQQSHCLQQLLERSANCCEHGVSKYLAQTCWCGHAGSWAGLGRADGYAYSIVVVVIDKLSWKLWLCCW